VSILLDILVLASSIKALTERDDFEGSWQVLQQYAGLWMLTLGFAFLLGGILRRLAEVSIETQSKYRLPNSAG